MYKPIINFVSNEGYMWKLSRNLYSDIFRIKFNGWEKYIAPSIREYFHLYSNDNRFMLGALYRDNTNSPHDYEIGMGGTCHVDETDKEAMIREIKEEMGIKVNPEVLFYLYNGNRTDTLYTVDLDKPSTKIKFIKYDPKPGVDNVLRKVHCLFVSESPEKIHELIVSIMKNKIGMSVHENIIGYMVINMEDAREFTKAVYH